MTELPGVVRTGPATDPLRVLLRSAASAGEVGIVEMEMSAGSSGPPLHLHLTHGEGFYVLTGQLTFQVGRDVVTGGPGTWLFAPRTIPHTLANFGAGPGRVLCVFAPGGFERRFERMLARQSGRDLPAELVEVAEAERATELVGPPLSGPGPTAAH
jgi:mannose-6-phosphate isomerase-like protein (cupin superfamily)